MVESKLVELVVAGSSPVGHPILLHQFFSPAESQVVDDRLPCICELMPGRVKFIFGLANDEFGYIIPKSEWDTESPYLYGAKKPVHGEGNSVGPETAGRIHQVIRELCAGH
jgi:hypothetical protein